MQRPPATPQGGGDGAEARTDPAPRGRRRRALWLTVRGLGLVLLAPVVMALVAAVLVIGRDVSAPSWIVREVELRAAESLAGGTLGFGAVNVTIGSDLHPRLVLKDVVLRDRDNAVLARVPRMSALLSPRGILQGRVLAQRVTLTGAQISLRRAKDGTVALAFDQGAAAIGAADGFLGLLDQVDGMFTRGALEALERVEANGLILNYVDGRAGRSWIVDDGQVALDLRGDAMDLRAEVALLSGRSFVTTAALSYSSPRGSRSGQVGVTITNAAARDIASQSPLLAWLGVLDAPISGAVRGQMDADGRLTTTSATLQIGAGEVQPSPQTSPVPFNSARTYLRYEPREERLIFDLIEVDSGWGSFAGTARTYLREFRDGWPEVLLGHIDLSAMELAPEALYDAPVELSDGRVDFRLRLDPFTFDIGQAVAVVDRTPVRIGGQVRAASEGWAVALDLSADEIPAAQVLNIWPRIVTPRSRAWVAENIRSGMVHNAELAFRAQPNTRPGMAVTLEVSDAEVRFMRTMPPIEAARGTLTILDRRMAMELSAGHVTAPEGGRLDLAGSTMVVPVTNLPKPPARFDLAITGRVTAAMSLLSQPPFNMLKTSDLPVSFAQGHASITVGIDTPLGKDVPPDARDWTAEAVVRDVRSDVLVPNRTLTSSALQVRADPQSFTVSGPMRLGGLGGTATFSRALGPGSEGTARVDATLTVGPEDLEALNITLPPGMLSGQTTAQLSLDLSDAAAPAFRLTSDLRGARVALDAVGWSKPRGVPGALTVAGRMGATPRIDELSLTAPGLSTSGTVALAPGGGLARAIFDPVRLGGWLNAPVVLTGRGKGRPVGVQVSGGTLDLRAANFGAQRAGEGGPISLALDTLQVTDAIRLEDLRGDFTTAGGFQGQFTGTVNGAAPVRGTVVPMEGGTAVRIVSEDAGRVLRATGLLQTAADGTFEMILVPAGSPGSYDGRITGRDWRVRDAPALASLLDAISVVGLLTQLDGQGLLFNDIEVAFRLTPDQVIVTQASATGPGLGISLDGIYATAARVMDFQGVISPFYLFNGIGSILTRPGEGLIGFNFNLRGPVDNPSVSVNPLSALTPGMFREIFRRSPPQVAQ
ncbi:DUF3971 domain-containing protein [Thalassorhabdomicrobium marinisediminis]|uniref:YhdP family protein n=1 Tax=Thalassorhabdomicrobium marinisediminis TaxID=2170577 RepID=UPI0024929DAE|nr:DUF3971 domain-containing protein [Thalassorhabdomicrobium marinisediminis]